MRGAITAFACVLSSCSSPVPPAVATISPPTTQQPSILPRAAPPGYVAPPVVVSDEAIIRGYTDVERSRAENAEFLRNNPNVLTATARPYGNTLMWALTFAKEEHAAALIDAGATDAGALRLAAQGGLDSVLEQLLDKGAVLNAGSGALAIHAAAKAGHVATVTLLLKRGAVVDARDTEDHDLTALHHAVIERHVDVVKVLLEAKASVHTRDTDGQTPLAWAGFAYKPIRMRIYNLHDPDADLHGSAMKDPGPAVVVKMLVDAGANVDSRDEDGNTPLLSAVAVGSYRGVEALLAAKASRRAKNDAGETALDLATARRDTSIVEILRAK